MNGPTFHKTEADYEADTYTVERTCTDCDTSKTAKVAGPQLFRYNQGAFVQVAFPDMSAEDREFFFMSGICPKCWDEIFREED